MAERAETLPDFRRYYARFARTHPAWCLTRIAGRAIRERAERYFGGTLLEIGCGAKRKRFLVGDLVRRHVGVDVPDCFHDRSRIDVFATAYRLPFRAGSFDCALSTAVLEHLEEPLSMLREARRVLKPGGHAIFTAPQTFHVHEEPRDFFRYTRYGLEGLCKSAGFEVVECAALSGFLVAFGSQFGYWLRSVSPGPLAWPARGVVALNNTLLPALDRGPLRREAFTWMNLLVARRPPEGPIERSPA